MLVVDLDGTLLRRDGAVSDVNRDALRYARDAGLDVVIATGRSFEEARPLLRGVIEDGLIVTAGGAALIDLADGRTVERDTFEASAVEAVTRHLLDDGHRALVLKDTWAAGFPYLFVGEHPLHPVSAWWFETLAIRAREVSALHLDDRPHDSLRVGAVASADRFRPLLDRMRDDLGPDAAIRHWSAVTKDGTGDEIHLLEAFAPHVNKWTMVERLARERDIPAARVAAIGDEINDVELLEAAGLGVAMGNAAAAARAVADVVTDHHEADGVASAVQRILAGDW